MKPLTRSIVRDPRRVAPRVVLGLGLVAGLALSGCAATPAPGAGAEASAGQPAASPRVAVAYEGGVLVLDGTTLEVLAEFETEEFTRLNAAGDGRHLFLTTSEGFQLLDAGTWTDAAGDARSADPEVTAAVVPAAAAGHVVRHADRTVLYDDATSDTTIFETADFLGADGALPEAEVVPGTEAHHGVSVVLEDGTLVTTVGDADGRTGIRALDDHGHEVAASDQCPGVHGEGAVEGEVVVFGCENGVLLYDEGEVVKLDAPDEFGRTGNAYVSATSPIMVGDYKSDPDAEGYLLRDVILVDTQARTLEVVNLPEGVEYTWRGVARGPEDDAFILASDGSIHVLDPITGDLTASWPVIEAWESPAEWQEPHPGIVVDGDGDVAYVTEPAANSIHAVDLNTGEVLESAELEVTPNEFAVATGESTH
ncbi:zinc metallochaperone AztD [Agromyces salentinus]|uniref:Zinc metallochaperone AztD n=1 Tax=Agromyces salentinus TaxID=269421 RepID=A0ABN2MPI4_9MICO|nr:zinc metallochaperone AztD [Agromyces salentinus]